MDKAKGVFKKGWHPEESGGIRGYLRKGGNESGSSKERALNHQSAPLSSLKDPDSFGPPPKHTAYYGESAAPAQTSQYSNRTTAPAPSTRTQPGTSRYQKQELEERVPTGPYRRDTTGLSTAHLPKPPKFGEPSSASSTRALPAPVSSPSAQRPKPALPARPPLPPRQNSNPDEFTPAPPPPYSTAVAQPAPTTLNQGALNRLGNAGVSVPGFNIGRNAQPPQEIQAPSTRINTTSPPLPGRSSQVNELQSRFSKMSTPGAGAETSQGTTFAQKQQALKTASAFRNDPSSVSLSDARSAASTANSFRERHGDQVATGWKTANSLNQKYGVIDKANGAAAAASKKPPPPPPKKRELTGDAGAPPPVPLGTKPKPT